MASKKPGIEWTSDTLTLSLAQANAKARAFLSKTTEYYSLQSKTFAKSKAPWTDRTGNARNSLASTYSVYSATSGRSTFQIDVFHGMQYGIWLEVRWSGKYAIINKTIQSIGPKFFSAANTIMARIFGGS